MFVCMGREVKVVVEVTRETLTLRVFLFPCYGSTSSAKYEEWKLKQEWQLTVLGSCTGND